MKTYHVFKIVFYAPLYAALIMTTALISACAAPETVVDNSPVHADYPAKKQTTQLMIKFTGALSESQVIQKLGGMGVQYHVRFNLLRAMSGGAYVITIKGFADAQQLARLLNAIGQRPDVVYVEQDRMMQHFQHNSRTPVY